MAGESKLASVPSLDEVETVGRTEFHIRGKHYEIEEIEALDYEKDAKTASDDEEGTTDMGLLTKLITLRAVTVDGKPLEPEAWGKEKFPVVNRVQNEVRRLHYIEVETDEEIAERKAEEAKAKAAEAKGAKKPKETPVPNS